MSGLSATNPAPAGSLPVSHTGDHHLHAKRLPCLGYLTSLQPSQLEQGKETFILSLLSDARILKVVSELCYLTHFIIWVILSELGIFIGFLAIYKQRSQKLILE